MGHSHLSKGIGQLVLGGRGGPRDHVAQSLKDDWLNGEGLPQRKGRFLGDWGGLGRYEAGVGPARNGSAVASRPSLPLSRTCHKGVAPPPPPPPPSGGPGSWRSQCLGSAALLWETTGDTELGRVRGLGTSVREGNSRRSLRWGDRTRAEGDSAKGPGREWRSAEPRKQPGGSPLRPALKAPGRGTWKRVLPL